MTDTSELNARKIQHPHTKPSIEEIVNGLEDAVSTLQEKVAYLEGYFTEVFRLHPELELPREFTSGP